MPYRNWWISPHPPPSRGKPPQPLQPFSKRPHNHVYSVIMLLIAGTALFYILVKWFMT